MTTYLTTEQAVDLAQQHGAVLNVLAMGRHDGVLMTPMELGNAMNAAIQSYIDSLAEGLPEPHYFTITAPDGAVLYQAYHTRDQLLACIAKAKGEK